MANPDPANLTLAGLLVVGIATSLHCAGMCGLLTCGLGIANHTSRNASIGVYHFCRLVGYFVIGSLFGLAGSILGIQKVFVGTNWLPFLLIALLLLIGLGFEKKIATIPGLGRVVHLIRVRTLRFPPLARAAIVGLSTPLLPCGPLYAVFAIALASGSWVMGGQTLLAFGLGAIPAIWITQIAGLWAREKFSTKHFQIGQRTLAGLAALSLSWHFVLPLFASDHAEEDGPACRCELPVPKSKGDQP